HCSAARRPRSRPTNTARPSSARRRSGAKSSARPASRFSNRTAATARLRGEKSAYRVGSRSAGLASESQILFGSLARRIGLVAADNRHRRRRMALDDVTRAPAFSDDVKGGGQDRAGRRQNGGSDQNDQLFALRYVSFRHVSFQHGGGQINFDAVLIAEPKRPFRRNRPPGATHWQCLGYWPFLNRTAVRRRFR